MKKTVMTAVALALAASLSGVAHAEKPSHGGGPRGPNIAALDTNGNGAVSRAEFEAGALAKAAEFFDKLDTNGDGVLTKADRKDRHDRKDRSERRGEKGGEGRGPGGEGKGKPWKHHERDGGGDHKAD